MIVALPLAAAVTRPEASTVATVESLDDHATSIAFPFASTASATRLSVSPNAPNVTTSGVNCSVTASCSTTTVALPDTEPAVAVTVAAPLATAVTRPDALTVATAALLLAQVTAAPAIT